VEVDLAPRLAFDMGADLLAPPEEMDAGPPEAVDRIAHDDRAQIAEVPRIFSVTNKRLGGLTDAGHSRSRTGRERAIRMTITPNAAIPMFPLPF
jgi:hypothetical protein